MSKELTELEGLVKEIQFKLKLTKEEVASRLEISRGYLYVAEKENTQSVIDKLKFVFNDVLQNVMSDISDKNEIKDNSKTRDDIYIETQRDLAYSIVVVCEANKILANNNTDLIGLIKGAYKPNPEAEAELQKQDSLDLSRTFDEMASVTDFQLEQMDTFEGRREFFHRIFALSQHPKNASGNFSKSDTPNKHKA